jgi:hypothetical protein
VNQIRHFDLRREPIVEDTMRALVAAVLLTLAAVAAVPAATDLLGHRLARLAAPAQDPTPANERPIEKLSLNRPSWEGAAGLLVAELTLSNHNAYAVNNVIIACDFFDASGNPLGMRGTAIRRIFEPGETRVSGVEFARFRSDPRGGACRMLSAKAAGSARQDDME